MLLEFCKTYLAVGAGGLACILVGWIVTRLINFVMGLIKGVLTDTVKALQQLSDSLDLHDRNAVIRDSRIVESINNLLELQNGSNPKFKEHDDRFDKLERRIDDKRL